jgi:hypothetical protein
MPELLGRRKILQQVELCTVQMTCLSCGRVLIFHAVFLHRAVGHVLSTGQVTVQRLAAVPPHLYLFFGLCLFHTLTVQAILRYVRFTSCCLACLVLHSTVVCCDLCKSNNNVRSPYQEQQQQWLA